MEFALISNYGTVYTGNSLYEIVKNTGNFIFKLDKGILMFNDEMDTITYEKHLSESDMKAYMTTRALKLLTQDGWHLYKEMK